MELSLLTNSASTTGTSVALLILMKNFVLSWTLLGNLMNEKNLKNKSIDQSKISNEKF
tara:strand:- start:80 stop:253 length:174 start_codon:yes stop_codon:yes gene_type:complete